MLIVIIATVIICVLFTLMQVVTAKKNPLSGLHNLPLNIQKRVHSLSQYQGDIEKILSTKERIIKKIPALIIVFAGFAGIVYLAGAETFLQGFGYAFGMWVAVKLYVTLVLTCGWYAHTPAVWIKGTEDMADEYKNYRFYLLSIPRSIFAGAIVSVLVGLVILVIKYVFWRL